jgi:hypothetical protein
LKEKMAEAHVVGIDLGTTNSLVAYMQGDAPVVIPGVDGSNLVPSVVALDPVPADGTRPTITGAGYLFREAADGPRPPGDSGRTEARSFSVGQ